MTIGKSLASYQPSAQPEARDIVAMLKNFPNVWATFNMIEGKKLLKVMFLSIYFAPHQKLNSSWPMNYLIDYCRSAREPKFKEKPLLFRIIMPIPYYVTP